METILGSLAGWRKPAGNQDNALRAAADRRSDINIIILSIRITWDA